MATLVDRPPLWAPGAPCPAELPRVSPVPWPASWVLSHRFPPGVGCSGARDDKLHSEAPRGCSVSLRTHFLGAAWDGV